MGIRHDEVRRWRTAIERGAFGVWDLNQPLELVHNRHLSLPEALRRLSTRPAELLGLPAGTLKRGAPADLILFDPEKPWLIEEKKLRSKSKNSPYDTRPVQGQVARTVVGGRTVFNA